MALFLAEVRTCVDGMQYKGYLLPPINFLEGVQTEYPKLVSKKKYTKLNSLQNYEDLLTRMGKIPKMLDEMTELLRLGIQEGVTYAKESLVGVVTQFNSLQVQVNASDFYVPFRDMPGSLGRRVVSDMRDRAKEVVENDVLPAFKKLGDFIQKEYL